MKKSKASRETRVICEVWPVYVANLGVSSSTSFGKQIRGGSYICWGSYRREAEVPKVPQAIIYLMAEE